MLAPVALIAAFPLLLSSASARVLANRDSQTYQVTAYTDGSQCNGNTAFTWPINVTSQGPQCMTFDEQQNIGGQEVTVAAGMGSLKIENLPNGKCVKVEYSNSGTCPFDESLAFPSGTVGNGCYNPKSFDPSVVADRSFANFALTLTDC